MGTFPRGPQVCKLNSILGPQVPAGLVPRGCDRVRMADGSGVLMRKVRGGVEDGVEGWKMKEWGYGALSKLVWRATLVE
jgi:hypothetical protein